MSFWQTPRPSLISTQQIQQNIANLQQQQNATSLLAQLATKLQQQQQQQQPPPPTILPLMSAQTQSIQPQQPILRLNNNNNTIKTPPRRIISPHSLNNRNKERSKSPPLLTTKKTRYSSFKIPKYSLNNQRELTIIDIKNRFSNLNIPNDFILCKYSWLNCLPIDKSLKLNYRCLYHIMKKEAKRPTDTTIIKPYEAHDSCNLWNVKVMLISIPNLNDDYLNDDYQHQQQQQQHPSKLIQFLIGSKDKNEQFALGGKWSYSLDGPNPDRNPQTLINTAIRTIKSLTNIDLSLCTKWYRFLEIQYEINNSNDTNSIETSVFFMVNVWNCMPNSVEYESIVEKYDRLIDNPDYLDLEESKNKQNSIITQEKIKLEPQDDEDILLLNDSQPLLVKNDSLTIKNEPNLNNLTRYERERMYKLPIEPHILVYPSVMINDCQLISLNTLLNYKRDDHLFELALFAECFNDMLMRDYGFLIYKALLRNFNKETNQKRKQSVDDSQKKRIKLDDYNNKLSKYRSRLILNNDVYLAFSYFDLNRNGYLIKSDLEYVLISLGINLSYTKLKAILSKLDFNKDGSFNYRLFCEQLNDDQCCLPNDSDLIHKDTNTLINSSTNQIESNNNLIEINGIHVDIVNTLKQLEKSEENYIQMEQRLKESQAQIEQLKQTINLNDKSKQRLQDDLQEYRKKLKDEQRNFKDIEDKLKFYKDTYKKTKYHLDKMNDCFTQVNNKKITDTLNSDCATNNGNTNSISDDTNQTAT
jgi:Ca2+-binding EF-hand superfamily protein